MLLGLASTMSSSVVVAYPQPHQTETVLDPIRGGAAVRIPGFFAAMAAPPPDRDRGGPPAPAAGGRSLPPWYSRSGTQSPARPVTAPPPCPPPLRPPPPPNMRIQHFSPANLYRPLQPAAAPARPPPPAYPTNNPGARPTPAKRRLISSPHLPLLPTPSPAPARQLRRNFTQSHHHHSPPTMTPNLAPRHSPSRASSRPLSPPGVATTTAAASANPAVPTPGRASILERLPPELLGEVTSQLGYGDLIALSQASRRLRAAVDPSRAPAAEKFAFVLRAEKDFARNAASGSFACYVCYRVRGPAYFADSLSQPLTARCRTSAAASRRGSGISAGGSSGEPGGSSVTGVDPNDDEDEGPRREEVKVVALRRFCIECGVREGLHEPGARICTRLGEDRWVCWCQPRPKVHDYDVALRCVGCQRTCPLRPPKAKGGKDGAI